MHSTFLKLKFSTMVAVASLYCAAAWAIPPYQDELFARYPRAAVSLAGCVACHDDASAGSLNSFGNAFLASGFALDAILEALDSDGDGASNGAELTASPATAPGDPKSKPGAAGTPPAPPVAADGPTLYANHCAACHGALVSSNKGAASLARTQDAIAGNVGGMGYLSSLSTAQVQAIVSALAPSAPASSRNYTGMWWKPAESGWGINVNHQGDIVFATLFTYDETGAPMWVMMTGLLQADGRTYAGDLHRVSGPAFNAQPFIPITGANLVNVGAMSLTFSSASTAALSYTYRGVAVSKDIVPQVFGTAAASCSATTGSRTALANYQDMWWNPAESGWGVNIVHQNGTLFATLMTYDLAGDGLWLVMSAGIRQSDGSYLGDLYQIRGPAFNAQPFTPITTANMTKVGTMRFAFADGVTGSLAYMVDGIPVSKSITRQVFASPVPACTSPVQPPATPTADGPTLYANHCAACHRALASSSKGGTSLARTQSAIAGNVGGMGYLSTLSTTQLQAIVSALASVAPAPSPTCGSCHGLPPKTGEHGEHKSRSCSTCHGAGYSSTTVNPGTHDNGIKELLASIGWNATSRSCANSCHGKESW